ncbi:MAG: autotransporter domain-containing protein [Reyranellaceae bacterium]
MSDGQRVVAVPLPARDAVRRRLVRALPAAASILALSIVAAPAAAEPDWSMYSAYTSLPKIGFVDPKDPTQSSKLNTISTSNPSNQAVAVFLNLNMGSGTKTSAFTMDTGSTGLAASSAYYQPGPNDKAVGPGEIKYTSSDLSYQGTYYQTNVGVMQNSSTQIATSSVTILYVTTACKADKCGPASPDAIAYMGVGYDRNALKVPPPAGSNINVFTSITQLASGASLDTYRQGYRITNGDVTLGLSRDTTKGYSAIKLVPDAEKSTPTSIVWTTAATSVVADDSGKPTKATLLPDTGIGYMFYTNFPKDNRPQTVECSSDPKRYCAVDGSKIQIYLPGQTTPLAGYEFRVGQSAADNPTVPDQVDVGEVDKSPTFVNTGREFFAGFDYYYDEVGGYVGYRATDAAANFAHSTPGLSLIGSVPLAAGFSETLPVFLYGDTLLQQSGSGSFGGAVTGNGYNLAVASGTIGFGAAIDMGGGSFFVQGGAAASLAATSTLAANGVQVAAQGTLTNNGTITATSVLNSGTLTNNNLITATTLTNFGTLNNNGTIVGAVTNNGQLNGNGTINGSFRNNGTISGSPTLTGSLENNGYYSSNGTINGNVDNRGTLAGNPTIGGNLVNSGVVAPGNSIGTVTVVGNATLAAGTTYAVETNAQGQSDKLVVGGTTTIQGGTVAAQPQGGVYAPRTTYTILTSAGGVTGTFGSASSSNPFLLPSLSYGANAVQLTLTIGGFQAVAQTPVQAAVGGTLDRSVLQASGDYAQVLGTLANTSPSQVPALLTSLSGMNYSGFSNSMVQTAQLFMSNFSDMAGGGARGRNRVALAEACDVACDADPAMPVWGAWGGAVGGLGTVGAGASLGGVTYNLGGFAGGLDRAVSDTVRAGVAVGYTTGSQWVSGFSGQGFSNSVQAGLYGSWLQGPAYLDGIAGYAYTGNQLNRPINIPGLPARTAMGSAGANQAYGQLEGGWRFDLGTAAAAWLTPFARLQGYTGTQGAFTESGAQSLSLAVAAQTTTSLRSVLGAQIGGAADLGWKDKLTAQLRLGWSHEYSSTARPVTASFVGAPGLPFTTYGVSPTRDGAVVGFTAGTAIADNASFYTRYEGMIAGQDSTHALTAGVRFAW